MYLKRFNVRVISVNVEAICNDKISDIDDIKYIIAKDSIFKIGNKDGIIFLMKDVFYKEKMCIETKLMEVGNMYMYPNLKKFITDVIITLYDEFNELFENDSIKIYLC